MGTIWFPSVVKLKYSFVEDMSLHHPDQRFQGWCGQSLLSFAVRKEVGPCQGMYTVQWIREKIKFQISNYNLLTLSRGKILKETSDSDDPLFEVNVAAAMEKVKVMFCLLIYLHFFSQKHKDQSCNVFHHKLRLKMILDTSDDVLLRI